MSFFDESSLCLIPSGYKDQKLYAVKPLDGSGDLAFSRASDATRVASNGLIEKVRTNLLTYSNTFSNAAWTKNNVTLTSGQADPNGGTNGTRAQFSGVSYIFQAPSTAYATASVYVRATSGTANIRIGDSNGNYVVAYSLTTSWQRITAFGSAMSGISIDSFIGGAWTSQDVIIAFAQFETGDIATDYIATTSAAVSVGPVSGLPRLDYLNSTCPRLLLEPQRTNLSTYSEQFNNAVWSKETGNSVTANTIASPDGYVNADTISATAGNAININQPHTSASNSAHTFSTFLKKNNLSEVQIYIFSAGFISRATVNLDNGTITNVDGSGATITNYGNGWYRCSIQGVVNSGVGFTIGYLTASTTGARSVYAYGSQLEVGAYATSYIPTLGTSVTRVADAASKTGISSLIGQTEGTIFWEIDVQIPVATALEATVNVDNGSFGNTIYLYKSGAGQITSEMYASSVVQASFTKSSITAGTYKCALAYANNNTAFFVNGVQIGSTDTSCSVPATNRIQMGQTAISSDTSLTKQLLLFKTRLTNAQLAELTTL
jgi:hypothetical protein